MRSPWEAPTPSWHSDKCEEAADDVAVNGSSCNREGGAAGEKLTGVPLRMQVNSHQWLVHNGLPEIAHKAG